MVIIESSQSPNWASLLDMSSLLVLVSVVKGFRRNFLDNLFLRLEVDSTQTIKDIISANGTLDESKHGLSFSDCGV